MDSKTLKRELDCFLTKPIYFVEIFKHSFLHSLLMILLSLNYFII